MDGFNWKQYRKNCPVPSGLIPYGKYSYQDPDGKIYSLDKFRPRFPLGPEVFRVPDPKSLGKFLPPSEDFAIRNISEVLRSIRIDCEAECPWDRDGPGRMGNVHWWRFFGGVVTLHRFKPFGASDFCYSLLMEFNPNKSDLRPWRLLRERCAPQWSNTRLDYALDIPFPISDVRLLTRKVGSSYQGTYYFGTRGSSGYTRVYDKRKEILDKDRKDIGREVTRVEWESHQSDPLHMDFPFILGDLGRYEVLRFVPMNDWPAALRTFDERTSSKIRRNCLTPVDVDPKIFDALRDELLADMGLDPSDCLDHIEKKRLDAADAEDLEKIQSTLRKWAGVDH